MRIKKEDLLLYAVAGRGYEEEERFKRKIEKALKGGITIFQLREKMLSEEELIREAKEILALCRQYKVPFIMNDSIEMAYHSGADGVHLGREDDKIEAARRILGERVIIGATAHNVEEALEAEERGADYLGVGAAFGSDTKLNAKRIDLSEYEKITKAVKIPVVAIGGIELENVELLYEKGLSGVAVSAGIFGKDDVFQKTREFRQKIEGKF